MPRMTTPDYGLPVTSTRQRSPSPKRISGRNPLGQTKAHLKTTTELVELAVRKKVEVKSLSVQNTTLDDVFVHFTGRQLRDEQVKAFSFVMPDRPGMRP